MKVSPVFICQSAVGLMILIEFLSDSDLAYFSEKIIPKITQLTIENQQRFPGLLYSFPASLKKQK